MRLVDALRALWARTGLTLGRGPQDDAPRILAPGERRVCPHEPRCYSLTECERRDEGAR